MTIDEATKYMKLFRGEWDENSKTKNAEALDAAIKFLEEFKKIKDLGECYIIPKSSKWYINGIDVHTFIQELQSYKQGNCTNDCEHFDNAFSYGYEKGIDDFLREIKIDVIATTFGLRICDAKRIAQQLKAGGTNGNSATDN